MDNVILIKYGELTTKKDNRKEICSSESLSKKLTSKSFLISKPQLPHCNVEIWSSPPQDGQEEIKLYIRTPPLKIIINYRKIVNS